MKILVINSGSSSIKYRLFDMSDERVLAHGVLERLGERDAHLIQEWAALPEHDQTSEIQVQHIEQAVPDHRAGLQLIFEQLQTRHVLNNLNELQAIGHRVVHGGERFKEPVFITDEVLEAIRTMIPLAPLHNPANLEGIKVCRELNPEIPQVAVFDTAFHQSMPPKAYHYAIPMPMYRDFGIRRYGFHGTSHHYVAQRAAEYLKQPTEQLNLITLHLGNGCSATAIRAGCCIDTSMGMTPLEGLIMGTRSGDIDPEIIFYLRREVGMTSNEIEKMLNKNSGLKGLCGVSDMREVQQRAAAGDVHAVLAEAMFAYRVKKYIGAYFAALGRLDAIVFTGGIGENSPRIRTMICGDLEGLGIQIESAGVVQQDCEINAFHHSASKVKLLVVPTNEELEIARSSSIICEQKTH